MTWNWAAFIAAVLAGATALYIRLRWWRAPQAFSAMVGVAICYFVAAAVLGAWVLHLLGPSGAKLRLKRLVLRSTHSTRAGWNRLPRGTSRHLARLSLFEIRQLFSLEESKKVQKTARSLSVRDLIGKAGNFENH